MSSVAAIGTALPGNAFYAATKAEVVILTRRFAMELERSNPFAIGVLASDRARQFIRNAGWEYDGNEKAGQGGNKAILSRASPNSSNGRS
jgi:NAD(P)-dependent dehydrogenase (short-subunit alcohol dehydrogenase family)